ncbi:hypothetical protein, partial [Pseudomonas oryzihabitans]|uniref:hypothetical protein n=1 Tax=Pseudomonas oryzihabitans TaxID=47885 RepID=UPI001F51727F
RGITTATGTQGDAPGITTATATQGDAPGITYIPDVQAYAAGITSPIEAKGDSTGITSPAQAIQRDAQAMTSTFAIGKQPPRTQIRFSAALQRQSRHPARASSHNPRNPSHG